MDFIKEVQKALIEAVRRSNPKLNAPAKLSDKYIDRSTQGMGYSKITKAGYTP
jgi:hypothetical protein